MIPIEVAPPTMSARERVEMMTARLTATQACAVVEHLFGVLPLIEFFGRSDDSRLERITSGFTLGALALGLFTPGPEPAWGAMPLTGTWAGSVLRVCGQLRLPRPDVEGALLLVQIEQAEQRLAWLDPRRDGVTRRDASNWFVVEGAMLDAVLVSRPVTLAPGSDLRRRLEEYASVWALAAVRICKRIVLALRRAARTTRRQSQLVTTSITEVEIETDLAAAAVDRVMSNPEPAATTGLVLALAAARILASATATARQLHDQLGLPLDAWLADAATTPGLTTYLGGTSMLENELARCLEEAL